MRHRAPLHTEEAAEVRADGTRVQTAPRGAHKDTGHYRHPGSDWRGRHRTRQGQGDRAARSGDGCAWTADALSQGRERMSNTHAKLRTKRMEEETRT